MTDYTAEKQIDHDVTAAFAYLADPANLPQYFPHMTSAKLVEPELVQTTAVVDTDGDGVEEKVSGRAWFHADRDAHEISWGSPGSDEYSGSLKVTEAGGSSLLKLRIHTTEDHPGVQESLDEALESIARRLAAQSAR
ncbi:SRPBCC family protein [Catellatospora sp. NPDC049609]|uniref:SRPBCC family protein n=1 Tax=Catellatospora sp. NPDC049609 TaxID=3155505 RepID=UPI00342A9597